MQQSDRTMLDDTPGARVQEPAAAGTALYQRHAPAIFAYLLKETGSREDAEDLLLDVFLAALKQDNLSNLEAAEQRAWLWAVAHHKAVDHFRRLARHPSIELRLFAETLYNDERLEPEQALLRREALTELISAIGTLPERQQEVLRLRFGHGLPVSEIADMLQKRESAVRMLLSRTMKTLRKLYPRP